jgi:hypothetical protein
VRPSGDVGGRVAWLAAAYAAGLVALMVTIAVVDSPTGAGIALAWILGVLFYARYTLRCPLCGTPVLNAAVGRGLRWMIGPQRRCPRCGTGYREASTARARAPAGGRKEPGDGPKEKRT